METINVLFSGVGGQGIILASKVLEKCAFLEGFAAKESELHGMAQRGGSVISHVRFGKKVYSPLIPFGKADYLVAMEELEGLRHASHLKPGATVILNTRRVLPSVEKPPYPEAAAALLRNAGFKVVEVNALEIAKEAGTAKAENTVLVGALSASLSFNEKSWEQVIRGSVPPKTVDLNLLAFRKGREAVIKGQGTRD